MELLNSVTAFLSKLIQWWFIVMPWEQAIRVRKGKYVKVLGEGLYFKVPFMDSVYIQTTRMRMAEIPMQTVSSSDGITVTVKSCIGYSICDILVLYKALYHPETTLNGMIMGMISDHIRTNQIAEITPQKLEELINEKMKAVDYGLKDITVRITTFAVVKTYRLISDSSHLYNNFDLPMTSIK